MMALCDSRKLFSVEHSSTITKACNRLFEDDVPSDKQKTASVLLEHELLNMRVRE